MRPSYLLALAPVALMLNAFAVGCTSDGAEGECAFGDEASGSLSSCGNIEVSASAECTVEVEGGCTAKCTPVNFAAACEGQCGGTISADCSASCQGQCEADCDVDPGSFDCQGSCEASCGANCEAECEASNGGGSCVANCQAACEGNCSASCEGTPPSAECSAKCEASCEGECKVESDFECQGSCYAELQGGCQVQCESPDGALYCDGQYVDAGNNFAECIASLNACLDVEVDASASAACENNACSAEAEASVSCATSGLPYQGDEAPWYALGLAVAGLGLMRRRRA